MLILEQGYSEDRWTDFNARYLKTRVSAGSEYRWESKVHFHNFRGQNAQRLPKLARKGITQTNPGSRKTAIYPSSMKLFPSNLTDRLKTGINIPNLQNLVKKGYVGSHIPFLKFSDPIIYREDLELKRGHVGVTWPVFGILGNP